MNRSGRSAAWAMKRANVVTRSPACFLLLVLAAILGQAGAEAPQTNRPPATPAPGAEWFAGNAIHRWRIRLATEDFARLRQHSRQDVPAAVDDGQTVLERVAIHLKGSTGSFRSLDDKPALTLTFDKFRPGQRFRGLRKVHLNNSVEDPSYFNELAGTALFRAAGVPAPRAAHALVELNGRPLGLYVLKEGFTTEFLGQFFAVTNGNLYDTGPGYDIEEALKKEQGDGPEDRSDLLALAAVVRDPDLSRRWETLGKVLDLDRFLSFMTMEVMACHRDGYCLARNNFRIYSDPGSGRMVFLPHGMDQLFGRPEATPNPVMAGLVARAVIETPEGRRQYRERLRRLLQSVFDPVDLGRRADAFVERVKPLLRTREFQELKQAVGDVKERMAQRRRFLEQQLAQPEPVPLALEGGVAQFGDWQTSATSVGGTLDRSPAPDGRKSLHISASARTSASWRTKVLLPKGPYRFEAMAFTKAVKALDFGRNQGAGLRVVGATPRAPYRLVGDQSWTKLEQRFTLEAEQEVELVCELRAAGGEVWFALDSLRLSLTERPLRQ